MSTLIVRIRSFALRYWQILTAYALLFSGLAIVLLNRLSTLLPGYSTSEINTYAASQNLQAIWQQPFNAPYHLLVLGLHYVLPNNLIVVRLASALLGGLTLLLFCILVHYWYGTKAAFLGTLIFGTSTWFLHVARLGTPAVCMFGLLSLIACGVWLRAHKTSWGVFIGIILGTALMYMPGMPWLIIIGVLWQWKTIDRAFNKALGAVTLGGIVFIGMLAPLGWYLYKAPHLIRDWLCIPTFFEPSQILHRLLEVPMAILFRGQENPEQWLGRLPILNVFGIAMFLLGIYVYVRQAKRGRTKLIAGLSLLAAVVIAFTNGGVTITILVPFVYLLVAIGICHLLDMWLNVFPRNPIARTIGVGMVVLIVSFASAYNLRSYFVAWPQATVTRDVFRYRVL